jgi:hypothetical protein
VLETLVKRLEKIKTSLEHTSMHRPQLVQFDESTIGLLPDDAPFKGCFNINGSGQTA